MTSKPQIEQIPQQDLPAEGLPVPSKVSNLEGVTGVTLSRKNPMAPAAKGKGGPDAYAQLLHEANNVCRNIVRDESLEELNWLMLAKTSLSGSKLSFSDADLKRLLSEAKAEHLGRKDLAVPGDVLTTRPIAWLWEGVIQNGTLNWVHALPKVGKTRLMLAMLGAFAAGKEEFLGQRLKTGTDRLLLLGPDMPENIWAGYLSDAGLLEPGHVLSDRVIALANSKHSFVLDQYWLTKVEALIASAGQANAIVLLDSFAAATATLPYDENKKEIATPLYQLKDLCAAYEATLIVIHHSRKGEAGKGAVAGSRGNSALTAAADNIVDLRRFQGENDAHKKIEIVVEGRHDAEGNLLVSQDKETKEWICHGSTLELRKERAQEQDYMKLTVPQTQVLHALVHHMQETGKGMTSKELRDRIGWEDTPTKKTHAHKILKVLTDKGFVAELGQERFGRYVNTVYGPTAVAMTIASVDQYL